MELQIAGIQSESIVDGPGLRTVIFLQGCKRKCPGCHNPETWDPDKGMPAEEDDLLETIRKNPLCHGVTYSGGEPFLQAGALIPLTKKLKERGYEVAAYTGFLYEELAAGTDDQKDLLVLLDVLIDGPFIQNQRSLDIGFRGSRNQRIIDVPASLKNGCVVESEDPRWRKTSGTDDRGSQK